MRTRLTTIIAAAFLTAVAQGAHAQTPQSSQTQGAASIPAPRLAPGVKAQAGYERVTQRFVVANPTRIFADITATSAETGELPTIGQPVNLIAKVKDWDWYLVGRDGVGVGYVPRGLLKPAGT